MPITNWTSFCTDGKGTMFDCFYAKVGHYYFVDSNAGLVLGALNPNTLLNGQKVGNQITLTGYDTSGQSVLQYTIDVSTSQIMSMSGSGLGKYDVGGGINPGDLPFPSGNLTGWVINITNN